MTRPAKPDYVNEMFLLIAVMMVRLNAAFFAALRAICGSCQQTFFESVRDSNASSRKHSGPVKMAIAPFFLSDRVPCFNFVGIFGFVPSFDNSPFIPVFFLPLRIIGCVVCWVFVGHTTILALNPSRWEASLD
jgi:fatty acid desaturase